MLSQIAPELVKLIPDVLWILLVAGLIALFYRQIRNDLLPRISGLNVFGFSVTFMREELDSAVEAQRGAVGTQQDWVSKNDREQTLRRAERIASIWRDAQILWVEDNQDSNGDDERRVMRSFGASIDRASSTEEALSKLKRKKTLRQRRYDAVISHMKQYDKEDDAKHFIERMRDEDVYQWITFYVTNLNKDIGVPADAHGITNRPDHLLHNVMDILERERS